MYDSVNTSQSDLNVSNEALLSSDYELNGTINRAASEGAKFALILAMLEQDCTHRPHVEKPKDINQTPEVESEINYYRSSSLSANDAYWQTSQQTSQLIHAGQLLSAHLWLAMHPEPLSLRNQVNAIDEEIIANCNINTQTRLQREKQNMMKVDETGLYDILQDLAPAI